MIAARIHAASQEAFWKHVLNGRDKPLGEIVDYWRRVEFQLRGSPHSHNLICVLRYRDEFGNLITQDVVISSDEAIRQKALDFLERIATARLAERHPEDNSDIGVGPAADVKRAQEEAYNFNVKRSEYFKDTIDPEVSYCHPCRTRMQRPTLSGDDVVDYTYRDVDGSGVGRMNTVAVTARRLQLANQMHCCQQSCHKYCKKGQKEVNTNKAVALGIVRKLNLNQCMHYHQIGLQILLPKTS
jgi:hypothetical protein